MSYEPRPIDTESIALSRDVQELTELLAKNTHDVWARQRLSEGWRYGPHRDDIRKEHPGLVPYEELSDSEQQYDRETAMQALRAIIALGYRLEPPENFATASLKAAAEQTSGDGVASPEH